MTTHADVMGRATACPECPNTEPPRDDESGGCQRCTEIFHLGYRYGMRATD